MRLQRAKGSQINKLFEFNHYLCENQFNVHFLFVKIFLFHLKWFDKMKLEYSRYTFERNLWIQPHFLMEKILFEKLELHDSTNAHFCQINSNLSHSSFWLWLQSSFLSCCELFCINDNKIALKTNTKL